QQEERNSVKEMQTIWMADHLGEEFDGTIVNVTDFGLFVRLDDNCCEGLIHITDLVKDDYMLYDAKNFRLIGERTGKTFTIGDRLHVKLSRADIDKRQIDFTLVEDNN
ncbi:MAG: S1 RNA-binding domain-containing protein, partial [Paludibacteraceae bacterium]|nr:S1 RNA-binding domain-containing protein [Paludibacteraceae bacterium]